MVSLVDEDEAKSHQRLGPEDGKPSRVSLQCRLEPLFALLETLHFPESPQRGRESQPLGFSIFVAGFQRPRDRPPQVPELGPQPPEPPSLSGFEQFWLGLLCQGQEVRCVGAPCGFGLPAFLEFLQRVLADWLK